MLQLNLLPDVKAEYIKAKHMQRMAYIISFVVLAVCGGMVVILFSLTSVQKRHISSLTEDIQKQQKQLQAVPDLAKILTIQNQMNSLPQLYDQRPVTSRLFSYIQQTTPAGVRLESFKVDYADNTFTIKGSADSLELVNLYADTLKFTKYTVKDVEGETDAFSSVVLEEFSRDDKQATFGIKLTFDTAIFDAAKDVTLVVPKTITTRSETGTPTSIFQEGTSE